jgi:pilus assembly protein Flp/PilA
MRELWNNFVADESGQGLTEYVLIIGLIAIASIIVMGLFGGAIIEKFQDWTTAIQTADTPPTPE